MTKRPAAPAPYPVLQAALLGLSPTRKGFEGLVTALIEKATEGRLLLMSSGDQGGLDGVGAPTVKAPRRAMQAKRYGQSTPLNLNTLLGEMSRAFDRFPGIDCWVMATTKALLGKEQEDLRAHAHRLGWGFVALEWAPPGPGLPPLAVLCASFPAVTLGWAGMAGVKADLDHIAADPDFTAAREDVLDRLKAADVGFRPAQGLAAGQLDSIFTDAWAARSIAGPSPALLVQAPPVERQAPAQAAADWWAGSVQVLALLGEEGMGKTWAALTSLRAIAAEDGGPLPIVISSKAAEAADDGLAAVITALCAQSSAAHLRLDDPPLFWRRRLERWSAATPGVQPRLLVLIDGLDEVDPFDWPGWLSPLLTDQWRGVFRIVLACRRDDWQQRVKLNDLGPDRLATASIDKFAPPERDAYLVSRKVEVKAVSEQVLAAALHPRTAFHLTRLAAELGDITRITREQLLLRDFQNRHDIKGGPLDPGAFLDLVGEMAQRAQQAALNQQAFSMTAGAIVDHVAAMTGYDRRDMRGVLSELVSGQWCRRDGANANRLTFTDAALPDAVGLALAGKLRSLQRDAAVAEIERFVEPWGADDLVEKVLRTCATALVVDPAAPDDLCDAVLNLWLEKPFRGLAGQDFWRRLHVFRPGVFLGLAARAGRRNPWIQEWGVACFWDDQPQHRPLILARLYDWMTALPLPAAKAGSGDRDRRRQARRLAQLKSHEPVYWPARLGAEGALSLQRTAARVMGFLPRAPFVGVLTGWAVSCAAAGRAVADGDVAILLRDNANDHAATIDALHAVLDAMAASDLALARRAATLLRTATGDPKDAQLAEAAMRPRERARRRAGQPWIEIAATPDGPRARFTAGKPPGAMLLSLLADHATAPDLALDPVVDAALGAVLTGLDKRQAPEWFAGGGARLAVLMRWRSHETMALLRAFVAAGPVADGAGQVNETDTGDYLRLVLEILPVLDADERAHALGKILALKDESARSVALTLRLAHAPLSEQIIVLAAGPAEEWPSRYKYLLNTPADAEIADFVRTLDLGPAIAAPSEPLDLALTLTRRFTGDDFRVERDWAQGFSHSDPAIAELSIELAERAGGVSAARQLAGRDWAAGDDKAREHAFAASDLLCELDDEALRPLLPRLSPEILGNLYLTRPALHADAGKAWRAWMEERLLVPKKSWSFGGGRREYIRRDEAYALYVADHLADVTAMLRRAWDDEALRSNLQHDDGEGPTWPLLLGLAGQEPELVKTVWRGAMDAADPYRLFSAQDMPATFPVGPSFDDVRREWLDHAHTDERLFRIVRLLERGKHHDFLHGEIARGLASARPLDVARAMTMAGFLSGDDRADALWAGALARPPGPGWLSQVHGQARAWFLRAVAMRAWWKDLSATATEEEALVAYHLFGRVADERYGLFAGKPPFKIDPTSWRAQWVDFRGEDLGKAVEEARKPLGSTWLHGPRFNEVINDR